MVRPIVLVLVVACSIPGVATTTAQADPTPAQADEDGHLTYPVTAAAFRALVSERIAKARARMEQFIADEHVDREKADALRARFRAAIVQINAKVDAVCADGTVTGDEAKAVHALAKALRRQGSDN